MCGRYTLTLPLALVAEELGLDRPEFEVEPRYNIAPTQRLPVLAAELPRHLQLMRWGLIPSWAKDLSVGSKMINARAESLAEKPAFRAALRQRRCLIPADGFYEWQATGLGKIPQHIHLTSRDLLTFGGLWESWRDGEGRELRTFTIITTVPNALMATIHDRMPVIIAPADRARWLDPQATPAQVQALMAPLPDGLLETQAVGDLVNSPRNEGPDLLRPPAQTSLF
jgi:putative SOS response-associated peptidase YedK